MGPAPLPSAADDIFVKLYHFFLFIHSLVVEENYLIRRRRGSEWQEAARIITTHPITFLLRGGTWINIRGPEESLEQQPRKKRGGLVTWAEICMRVKPGRDRLSRQELISVY